MIIGKKVKWKKKMDKSCIYFSFLISWCVLRYVFVKYIVISFGEILILRIIMNFYSNGFWIKLKKILFNIYIKFEERDGNFPVMKMSLLILTEVIEYVFWIKKILICQSYLNKLHF